MTKYIHMLSNEDIEQLASLCFKNFGKIKRTKKEQGDYILISGDVREFELHDYYVVPGYGLFKEEYTEEEFLKFMYEKYGRDYLEDFYADKFQVTPLWKEVVKADQKYREAIDKCMEAVFGFEYEHKKEDLWNEGRIIPFPQNNK